MDARRRARSALASRGRCSSKSSRNALLAIVLVNVGACARDKGGQGEASGQDETGEGPGDGTNADADDDGVSASDDTPTSMGSDPSATSSADDSTSGSRDLGPCQRYLDCATASEQPITPILGQYGVDGTCWEEFDEDACWADCRAFLSASHDAYPDIAACDECESDSDCVTWPDAPRCASGECRPPLGGCTGLCELVAPCCESTGDEMLSEWCVFMFGYAPDKEASCNMACSE